MNKNNAIITVAVILLASGLLIASAAAPALALDDGLVGSWNGTLERNGAQRAIAMRFTDRGGIWNGRLEIDGRSSPMETLSVDGDRVRFTLPDQGVFDGRISNDSLVGSVAGSNPGSFMLTRRESEDPFGDAVDSEGP